MDHVITDPIRHLTNCQVFSTVEQQDDEKGWLLARTRGIGGSDIGSICGVNKYSSPLKVYFSKTGQFEDAMSFNSTQIERMRFGHLFEPVVAEEYAHRTGAKLAHAHATVVHCEFPWALANVDRLIVDDDGVPIGILECKTANDRAIYDWEEGEIPLSYIYQVMWYLWVTGLERGAIAGMGSNFKYLYYDIFIDWDLVAEMYACAKDFWENNVCMLIEPEMSNTDTDLVNTLYVDVVKGSETTFEDDVTNELAATVVACKKKIKELEATMEEAQNRLKKKLQDHEIGYTKDYIVKWSPRSQNRVSTEVLKTEYPEVYNAVVRPIYFRAMSIKGDV